jgi:hypothetical protein
LKQEWPESSVGTRQTDGKNLVWFGKLERKLAKLSKTTFAYRSSSSLFYGVLHTNLSTNTNVVLCDLDYSTFFSRNKTKLSTD